MVPLRASFWLIVGWDESMRGIVINIRQGRGSNPSDGQPLNTAVDSGFPFVGRSSFGKEGMVENEPARQLFLSSDCRAGLLFWVLEEGQYLFNSNRLRLFGFLTLVVSGRVRIP